MNINQGSLFSENPLSTDSSSPSNLEFSFRTANWLLGLMQQPGIGPNKALSIATNFQNLDALSDADPNVLKKLLKGSDLGVTAIREVDSTPPDDVKVITYFDHDYPAGLRDLASPPPILWYRGTISLSPSVAIVGTREPSLFGLKFARQAGEVASQQGISVVSGLALGIDSAAHEGSLSNLGVNVAVLACDVRRPTPKGNSTLADQILENGGCLVAEVPPGTETEARNLVARNRIQAAWSKRLIMAECGIPSGTLHTVRFALEIARPVGVYINGQQTLDGDSWAGNVALSSIQGLDPQILGGTKSFQDKVKLRKPCADVLLDSRECLLDFLQVGS
jgi:DNA processing protein